MIGQDAVMLRVLGSQGGGSASPSIGGPLEAHNGPAWRSSPTEQSMWCEAAWRAAQRQGPAGVGPLGPRSESLSFEPAWSDAVARRLQVLEDEALAHRLALEEQEGALPRLHGEPQPLHIPSLTTRLANQNGAGPPRARQAHCRRCGNRFVTDAGYENRPSLCATCREATGVLQLGGVPELRACEFCGAAMRLGSLQAHPTESLCWSCSQALRPTGPTRFFGASVREPGPGPGGRAVRQRTPNVAPLVELLNIVSQERQKASPAQASDIAALPTQKLTCANGLGDQTRCLICLEDFQADECLTTMPCLHLYHQKCIEKWLNASNSCPVCKTSIGGGRHGRHAAM